MVAQEVVARWSATAPAAQPQRTSAAAVLADILHAAGRDAEARPHLEAVLAAEEASGASMETTRTTRWALGRCLANLAAWASR